MWRTVLGLEWRILRRDKAALGILLLFAAFVVAAAIAGGRQADSVRAGLARSQAAESVRFQGHLKELRRLEATQEPLTGLDPRDTSGWGKGAATIFVLPPAPLAPIAVERRPGTGLFATTDHLSSSSERDRHDGPTRR